MNSRIFRTILTGAVAATALLAAPAESHAIFEWLTGCCGGNKTPTYSAAPVYGAAAAADAGCAPPQVQTVNYVPQTCYRTQYVSVPVTTYRPAVGRDPCTGCPVNYMRPATTVVQQARLVPYTTYRIVASNPCCGATAPAMATGYAPASSAGFGYAPPTTPCCGGNAAAPANYASPAGTPYYGSAGSGSSLGSGAVISGNGAAAAQPTLGPIGSGNPTFQPSAPPIRSQKPIQSEQKEPAGNGSDSDTDSGKGAGLSPRLFQPNDRTTSYPILRVNTYRPISYRTPAPQAAARPQRPLEADGWRPSTR